MEQMAFLVLGLIVGSFLNVLIARWGVKPVTGRSECPACGRQIAWFDLVPVFSWFALRGHCRSCGARISFQYVLVEAGTGALFFCIGAAPLPLFSRSLALPIAAVLIAIAAYDLKHTLIPNAWAYTFAALSLGASLTAFISAPYDAVALLVAGPLVALPLFSLWFFSKGAWMGFGDVKFALGMGWLLGIANGLLALLLAFMLGALVSVPLLFFSSSLWESLRQRLTPIAASRTFVQRFTMKSEIPFGPFLVAATLIVWIAHMYGTAASDLLL